MQEYGVETLQQFMQKYGVETVQYYVKYFQNAIEELDIKMKKIETAIRNLKAQAKDLDSEQLLQLYHTKNGISMYNNISEENYIKITFNSI